MRKTWCIGILLAAAAPAAAQDMTLQQILIPGEGWQVALKESASAGCMAGDGRGNVYVADPVNKRVWRIDKDGKSGIIYQTENAVVGLASGPDGIYASQPAARRIIILAGAGEALFAQGLAAEQLAVTKKGEVYCTVPDEKAVYRVVHDAADGVKRKVASDFISPGALALWADGGTLIVGEAGDKYLDAFRVRQDGDLDAKDRYYPFFVRPKEPSDNAGLTLDAAGRAYATSRRCVQAFDPTGRLIGALTHPEPGAALGGVAFGGADLDRLYVACGGKVYARKVQAKGVKAVEGKGT